MQVIRFEFLYRHWLNASLIALFLLASSSCAEQAPRDAQGKPYTLESIHALIDDLGKYDVKPRKQPPFGQRTTVLTDKRRAAVQTLSELGDIAIPIIVERLSQIPELEQALLNQSDRDDHKQELNWLLSRKADLISLLAGTGNEEHGKLLLMLAETKIGTGKVRAASLVLALRGLGAKAEEQIMLDRLFKSPDEYGSGAGSLLEYFLTMRKDSDKALATRVASWPLESKIKGRAVLLAARLGVKEPILAEIKSVLQRTDLPAEIRYPPYELGLHLSALAELLPPDDYKSFTADAKLLQNERFGSVVQAAQERNQFWWAEPEEKDELVFKLFATDDCANDILALHYMLKNKRIDFLQRAGLVFDRNVLKRQTQPELQPYYERQQRPDSRILPTGFKLSTLDGKVIIENIPGFGMFD